MKKLLCSVLVLTLLSTQSFADCDWTKIVKNSNNTFTYSEELHLCVGKLVQDSKVKDQQIADYQKAINLKDLALKDSDSRVTLWQHNADDNFDKLNKLESSQKSSDWTMFALGALTVISSGFLAARLINR